MSLPSAKAFLSRDAPDLSVIDVESSTASLATDVEAQAQSRAAAADGAA